MTYLERLRATQPTPKNECALGRVLQEEGQEKYDDIVATIFAHMERVDVDEDGNEVLVDTGRLYPVARLVTIFFDEYGWGENMIRRHRRGECLACLNR